MRYNDFDQKNKTERSTNTHGSVSYTHLGMTELRDLDLTYGGYSANGAVEYESLAPLASLTKLNTLTIRNLKVSDLSPLAGLSDLKSLTIHNGASIRDLSPLAGLSDLKSLTIQGARHELDTSALSQVSKISVEP